ncbi:MAG: succinoglycan biosynthesis transport protein ExoP, partial [Saprospiraceae bacterium]
MTLIDFLRIIGQHFKIITIVSILASAVVFFATKDTKKKYTSHTLINTGLVSGYNIKSSSGGKVDYAFTNNELENLLSVANSYEMMEALATNLLAQYLMLNASDSLLILSENFQLLQEEIGGDFFKEITDKNSFDKTLNNVLSYRDRQEDNPVNALIYSKHGYFGIEHIKSLQITREGNSDMIRFKYGTTDPGVCRQTLVTLTNLFIQRQITIKSGQSTDVLAFFENATRESSGALKVKEDELLQFMVRNKIINYYEQTRFIASKKEGLDEMFFKEQMKLAAADSALSRVKVELSNRFEMPQLNQDMLEQQAELTKASTKMALYESIVEDSLNSYNPELDALRQQVSNIKAGIQANAVAAFSVQRTPEGAEMKDLLTHWLNQLLDVEQGTARLQVFRKRKKEFDETYRKFAPWGSKLKRIEREIDVAERAYLENLHSYNQARLHQHSMMMSTNLKVIDAPFFSPKPESSKRGVLIIVAFLGGLMLSIGLLVALELMDGTLKTPLNASNTIGIELLGAFPFFPKNWESHSEINFSSIHTKSFGQLYQ